MRVRVQYVFTALGSAIERLLILKTANLSAYASHPRMHVRAARRCVLMACEFAHQPSCNVMAIRLVCAAMAAGWDSVAVLAA